MHFASCSEDGALILYLKKNNFENFRKLQGIVNIFVFFIKISCQSKESPFLNNPPLVQPLPFLKKYFIPTLFLEKIFHPRQIRGSQSSPYKGEGGFELCQS